MTTKAKKKVNSTAATPTLEEMEKLKEFTEKVDAWYSLYSEHIERARNYLIFLYVDQWEAGVRQARELAGKPTLSVNKLVPVLRGILGEQRDNSPQLAVRPVNPEDDVPQEEIDLRSDLIRQISYDSNSDIVYQIASQQMLECGWGSAFVKTEPEDDNSFNQVLRIISVVDFQCGFFDPCAQEPDKSDGDFCGYYTVVSKDHFERMYPDVPNPESAGNNYVFQWFTRETVTLCDMYYKDYYNKTLVQLSNGQTLEEKEAKELLDAQDAILEANPDLALLPDVEPITIQRKEVRKCYKIKHIKFVLNKTLEETEWPGKKYLPGVYFEGDSRVIDGERIPLPFIQDAIDTQKLINYNASEMAYALLTSRKEHIFATPSNVEGFEEQYRNPQQVQGALMYNPDEQTQQPPVVIPPVQLNPLYLQTDQKANSDLQQLTGRFEEARGQESNAVSGVAIAARKEAASAPVNVYNDNWARGIRQIGRILLDAMPYVYDNERTVMTRNVEGKSVPAKINQFNGYQLNESQEWTEDYKNDIRKGKYDIEVKVEGSFDAQNAKAFETFTRFMAINPQMGVLVADLMAEVSGLPNAEKVKQRFESMLPPEIAAQEKGLPPPPPPPPAPPPPEIVIAQMKQQVDMEEIAVKKQKNIIEAQKNEITAQANNIDGANTFAKAQAEVIKSGNELKSSLIEHGAKVKQAQIKADSETQKIDDAMQRRVALDEQAQTLKGMGI